MLLQLSEVGNGVTRMRLREIPKSRFRSLTLSFYQGFRAVARAPFWMAWISSKSLTLRYF